MRILIADDDATSRLSLKAMAAKLGHDCLVAVDGSSAWEMLAAERVDVLLTDWMMPGIDGPELCRRVRHELGDRYIYIVLITALGYPERVLEGMGAGADDYLVKPIDPFAVQARLVAAERVTTMHRQLEEFGARLKRANLELLGLSRTDALTGLGNRRHMEEDLAGTHARALRLGRTFGIAMFDIDHFKLYNDHYGHLAGDEALRQVARCLDKAARKGESVYRYGGEEFLLLLPDCSGDDAALAAWRIRGAVTGTAIPHEARPTAPAVVTVSGGVSCWTPGSNSSVPELLYKADEALYQAKLSGRNRVQVTVPDPGRRPFRPVVYDSAPLEALVAYLGASGEATRIDLIETYLCDVDERLAVLTVASQNANGEAVAFTAHALKSASAELGLLALSSTADDIETSFRAAPEHFDIAFEAARLTAECHRATAALRTTLPAGNMHK